MTKLLPWKVALFDVDGTLLDSNDAHARAWVHVLAANGYPVPYERVRPLIGKGGAKLLLELAGLDEKKGEGERLSKERQNLFKREFLPTLAPTRGARSLLEGMRDAGLALTIAPSAGGQGTAG